MAWRCKFYFRVVEAIFYERAQWVSEIVLSALKNNIHIFAQLEGMPLSKDLATLGNTVSCIYQSIWYSRSMAEPFQNQCNIQINELDNRVTKTVPAVQEIIEVLLQVGRCRLKSDSSLRSFLAGVFLFRACLVLQLTQKTFTAFSGATII